MKLALFVTGSLVFLSACGGGGGGSGERDQSPVATSPLQGTLVAPVVEGISYKTKTLSGLTDSNGAFSYREGEEVTFYLGRTQVGHVVQARDEIDFIELFPSLDTYDSFHDLKVLYSLAPTSQERMEFNRFHNSLALLEAFDVDSDLSNGILIEAGVEDLLETVTFDISVDAKSFINGYHFLYFRNIAQANGLIDSASISALGMPLDVYYANFSTVKSFKVPVEESTDPNLDGVPDSRYVYEYDQYGNTLSRLHSDGSGEPFAGNISTFNTLGQMLTNTYDMEGDGVIDSYAELEYDLGGNLVLSRVDSDADGSFDYGDIYRYGFSSQSLDYTWLYDADGDGVADKTNAAVSYILDEGEANFSSVLSGGIKVADFTYFDNGKPASVKRYFYNRDELSSISEFNENGQLLLREEYQWQSNVRYVKKWEYFYSEEGRLIELFYKNFDTYSSRYRYEYNELGQITTTTVEYYEKGTIGNKRDYEYSDDGLLINEYRYETILNDEIINTPSYTVSYKYNGRGQVIEKMSVDHTYDVPDDPEGGITLMLYGYNAEGDQIYRRSGSVASELSYKLETVGWRAALEWLYSTSEFARLPYEETLILN